MQSTGWNRNFHGMGGFWLVWAGQSSTLIGNAALRFAFIVEIFVARQRATDVVLLTLAALLPKLVLSPLAGVLVDRWNRRLTLQLADVGGFVAVGALLVLHLAGGLQPWQVYLAFAVAGAAEAFQYPAFSAAVPLLVDKHQIQRANGLLATAKNLGDVLGAALGGVVLAAFGLGAVISLDLASFVVAVGTVWLVRGLDVVPVAGVGGKRNLLAESSEGLRYLLSRPSLRNLTVVFFVVNLASVFGFAVLPTMILARTSADAAALSLVNVSLGLGGIAGGVLLTLWGGPRDRVRAMRTGMVVTSVMAQIVVAVVTGTWAWAAAAFAGAALIPLINGSLQSVIQTKVPISSQGKVFGAVIFVGQLAAPLAMVSSGPLADHFFEPWMRSGDGVVAALLAPLTGSGPGSGMAAMLLIAGVCSVLAAVVGMGTRAVRDIDVLLPDLEADKKEGDHEHEPVRG